MFLLKIVTVIALGLLALQVLGFLKSGLKASKVRVKPEQQARAATRLTQDPRTGVYYPEN